MTPVDIESYQAFLQARRSDLRRISSATAGEHSIEDLEQAAWLAVHDLSSRRGELVTFSAPADQEDILAWLYNRHARSKSIRYTLSLDAPPTTTTMGQARSLSLLEVLKDPGAGPLALLEAEEQAAAAQQLLRDSYSQAAAYVLLLKRSSWNATVAAATLGVLLATLRARMLRALDLFALQPSLFDGLCVIDPAFATSRRGFRSKSGQPTPRAEQASWGF